MRLLQWAATALLATAPAPVAAFDDRDFCIAARQLAAASESDVGIWVDRTSRNAGMIVACDSKRVTFTRFSYMASAAMTDAWKTANASAWNAAHCNSPLWKDAIANGWSVVLNVATADGGRALFTARCDQLGR
jgi:hypothetical protein